MSQPNKEPAYNRAAARSLIARQITDRRAQDSSAASGASIIAICRTTGISYTIASQGLDKDSAALLLDHSSPFASQTAAHKLIKHGKLSSMSAEILAGLALSIATHHRLVALQDMSAIEANAVLRTVEHSILCSLVRALYAYATTGHYSMPCVRAMPECAASITYCVKEWTKDIAACLPSAAQQELARIAGDSTVTVLDKRARNAVALAKVSNRLAKYEVAFEASDTLLSAQEEFKAAKAEAKAKWAAIKSAVPVSKALADIMATLLQAQNLNACNPALRAKIVTAITHLAHPQAQALARLIKDTCNPYDIFATNSVDLEDSGLMDSSNTEAYKGMSLRDRMAAIKAARVASITDKYQDAIAEGERQGQADTDKDSSTGQSSDSGSAANDLEDF